MGKMMDLQKQMDELTAQLMAAPVEPEASSSSSGAKRQLAPVSKASASAKKHKPPWSR